MSMDQGPTTPDQQRPSLGSRQRSRGVSFRSDKSGGSISKKDAKYIESPRAKAERNSVWRGASKVNPNAAINEDQPAVANVTEQSTLQNLRDYQHRDANGNVIADPDRSNPTRPRMERPLDTIKSFERAINDGYKRRSSYMKQDSAEPYDPNNQFASRRSSYFGGESHASKKPRSNANAPAGSDNPRGPPHAGHIPRAGGYYGSQAPDGYNVPNGPPRTRYGSSRMQPDQPYGNKPYAQHYYHNSHDTVNTGVTNGSDSTGPWANSTDPSSENSSIDRVTGAMNKPSTPGMEGYGPNGYNGPIMEEQASAYGNQHQANGYDHQDYGQREAYGHGQQNGYAQPNGYGDQNGYGKPMANGYGSPQSAYGAGNAQASSSGRRPIQLGNSDSSAAYSPPASLPSTARPEGEKKKKGWLGRRFSKRE